MIIFLFSSVLCPYLQSTSWRSYSVRVSFAVAADAVVAQAVKEPQVITDNMQKNLRNMNDYVHTVHYVTKKSTLRHTYVMNEYI